MKITHQPIPEELTSLKEPTRADAIEHLQTSHSYGTAKQPATFEETPRGVECQSGKWNQDYCTEQRAKFDKLREQGINSSMIGLQSAYERNLKRRQQIEEGNAVALEAEITSLRSRYMAIGGATEESFQKDLPGLLEARRRDAALTGQTEHERMVAQMRGSISI